MMQYVDGAMSGPERTAFEALMAGSEAVRLRVSELTAEHAALRGAFRMVEEDVEVPALKTPFSLAALWVGWAATAVWVVNFAWGSLAAASLPQWLRWLAPEAADLGFDAAVVAGELAVDGGDLLSTLVISLGWIALVAGIAMFLIFSGRKRRPRENTSLVGLLLVGALLVVASPAADAFELRRDDTRIEIGADETLDDTLVAAAQDVVIEGVVHGDVIATGERVVVRGEITGALISSAEEVSVSGTVGGSIITAGERIILDGAAVGSNLFAAGRKIVVDEDTRVDGNGAVAGQTVSLLGSLGRDLYSASRDLDIEGRIGGLIQAAAGSVDVGADAVVDGSVTLHAPEEKVQVDPGATLTGGVEIVPVQEHRSEYERGDFYVWGLIQFIGAFLVGVLLFRYAPSLREMDLESDEVAATVGYGAMALLVVPVLAIVGLVTLVGIPLALIGFCLWMIALYLAVLVVAVQVGDRIIDPATERDALALFVGLLIVTLLMAIPVLGGIVWLAVVLVGLGLMVRWVRGSLEDADPAGT